MDTKNHRNALTRAILSKLKPQDEPDVGRYDFHDLVELEVRGSMRKGEPSKVKATAKLPVLEILAFVVSEANIDSAKLIKMIRHAAKLSDQDKKGRGLEAFIEHTKAAMRTVEDELADKLAPIQRAGAFTGEADVQVVKIKPLAFKSSAG